MSNIELRLLNEEVGIRVLTQMVVLKDLFTCLPAVGRVLGTSPAYRRQVQILDTFFNVEYRTPIVE